MLCFQYHDMKPCSQTQIFTMQKTYKTLQSQHAPLNCRITSTQVCVDYHRRNTGDSCYPGSPWTAFREILIYNIPTVSSNLLKPDVRRLGYASVFMVQNLAILEKIAPHLLVIAHLADWFSGNKSGKGKALIFLSFTHHCLENGDKTVRTTGLLWRKKKLRLYCP